MVKHIGIVAVSFEGAALCYRTICEEAIGAIGRFTHPEITMHTHSLSRYMYCIENGDWNGVASLMLSSAKKLFAAGAEFGICPDNTVHRVFEKVAAESPIPLLSIVETAAKECCQRRYRKVGLLGTKYIMEGPSYRDALSRLNIETVVPTKKDQDTVNSVIFDELVPQGISSTSVKDLLEVIGRLKRSGCEAVILGCTELPLVVNSKNSPLPVVDTTRLLAVKALDFALDKPAK